MLDILCGSANIHRILLFLFVNGKGYGTQIHRLLSTPLTAVQKALERLEKGGIITSYLEGKTRLYRFNPAFPLYLEVEQLLKKAYTLLSAQEKKRFYVPPKEMHAASKNRKTDIQIVLNLWKKLASVTQLAFHAQSKSSEELGWNGNGRGEVGVSREKEGVLIFHEKGSWRGKQGGKFSFSNVFRWTLDRNAGLISLEHLRRGAENPVFLFHLAPTSDYSLASIDSHLCEADTYFGQIFFDRHALRLKWRVIGPKKNEEIDYFYS